MHIQTCYAMNTSLIVPVYISLAPDVIRLSWGKINFRFAMNNFFTKTKVQHLNPQDAFLLHDIPSTRTNVRSKEFRMLLDEIVTYTNFGFVEVFRLLLFPGISEWRHKGILVVSILGYVVINPYLEMNAIDRSIDTFDIGSVTHAHGYFQKVDFCTHIVKCLGRYPPNALCEAWVNFV